MSSSAANPTTDERVEHTSEKVQQSLVLLKQRRRRKLSTRHYHRENESRGTSSNGQFGNTTRPPFLAHPPHGEVGGDSRIRGKQINSRRSTSLPLENLSLNHGLKHHSQTTHNNCQHFSNKGCTQYPSTQQSASLNYPRLPFQHLTENFELPALVDDPHAAMLELKHGHIHTQNKRSVFHGDNIPTNQSMQFENFHKRVDQNLYHNNMINKLDDQYMHRNNKLDDQYMHRNNKLDDQYMHRNNKLDDQYIHRNNKLDDQKYIPDSNHCEVDDVFSTNERSIEKKHPKFKHVVVWKCTDCEQECFPVREQSRCLCGHRLKDHPIHKSANGTIEMKCSKSSCRCDAFNYIVAEGAWILRCRCKHKHTDHNPVSSHLAKRRGGVVAAGVHPCEKKGCDCASFDSPWVCNCNHPWSSHKQSVELRQVLSIEELVLGGNNDTENTVLVDNPVNMIGTHDQIKRTDLFDNPLHTM